MSFLQRAREMASEVADATTKAAGTAATKAQDPATHAKVRGGLQVTGRGVRTVVERIDPGILADVIIKATALQEKANARLRQKGSIYRIGELQVTASIPPGVSFSIVRTDDPADGAASGERHTSTELLAAVEVEEAAAAGADAPPEIVSLDGEAQAAIAFELARTEASLDALVEELPGAAGADDSPGGARA